MRSSSQMPVSTCLFLSPGSYYLRFWYYELLRIYPFYIKICYFRSFPIYIYTNIYIYMGTQWIRIIYLLYNLFYVTPVIGLRNSFMNSQNIYEYTNISVYTQELIYFPFNFPISKNTLNYFWDIPLKFLFNINPHITELYSVANLYDITPVLLH